MKNTQKEDLKFVAYSYLFPEIDKPRNQRRSLEILEGAIQVYAKHGAEGATDDLIAKASGVSRPLIFRYFKDREELFGSATKYVRVNFQYYNVATLEKEKTAAGMLQAYIKGVLDWIEDYPDHAKVLIYFLYTCSLKKSERRVNTEFNEAGQQRIAAILKQGNDEGRWQCKDPAIAAKMILTVVMGAMVTCATEELSAGKAEYRKSVTQACLRLAEG